MASDPDPSIRDALAPGGVLRAALNVGNPILAASNTVREVPAGVTIDLSRELARQLGVAVELNAFATAAEALQALEAGQADIGFMAIDPARQRHLHFTAPYVRIEGAYAVPRDSAIVSNDAVDRDGVDVVVGIGSAYDLFLSRHLEHARIVRVPLSDQVIETMLERGLAVAAGVRQQVASQIEQHPGARLLPQRFMVIRQACTTPVSRGAAAHACLDAFIERMKASGFVAAALQRHGIEGAEVA